MNSHRCCTAVTDTTNSDRATGERVINETSAHGVARRGLALVGWVVPSVLLAVLPKCPMCVAAYVAMGTGLGLSLSTATYLRTMLMIGCALVLSYLAIQRGHDFIMLVFSGRRSPLRAEHRNERLAQLPPHTWAEESCARKTRLLGSPQETEIYAR
jgi:hypothetical protein